MNWIKIEDAKLVKGELYLCWDGKVIHKISDMRLPPDTTHIMRITPPFSVSIEKIERVILKYFDIAHEYLFRDCNSRRTAHRYPRQLMWYILNEHALVSKNKIAFRYGFDRATVIFGVGAAKRDIGNLGKAKQDYEAIMKLIQQ